MYVWEKWFQFRSQQNEWDKDLLLLYLGVILDFE